MAGFLSWVQFILKLWSCLLPGQKLILSGNVLVHFLFLLSTGKNGINTKLFKSSEFGYCLFLVFFFFILWFQQSHALPNSDKYIICSHGCQCLNLQGLRRYVWSLTRPIPIPVLVHVKKT